MSSLLKISDFKSAMKSKLGVYDSKMVASVALINSLCELLLEQKRLLNMATDCLPYRDYKDSLLERFVAADTTDYASRAARIEQRRRKLLQMEKDYGIEIDE